MNRPARRWRVSGWILVFFAAGFVPAAVAAPNAAETARIERLIAAVEAHAGLRFVRNGSEHDAAAAADHLRTKLRRAGARISSAEEFIDQLASRSSISGLAYRVRLPDGRELPASEWLHGQLRALEREPRR